MTAKRNIRAFFLACSVSFCLLLLCAGLTWARYNTAQTLGVSDELEQALSLQEKHLFTKHDDSQWMTVTARLFSGADKITVLFFQWCCETGERLFG